MAQVKTLEQQKKEFDEVCAPHDALAKCECGHVLQTYYQLYSYLCGDCLAIRAECSDYSGPQDHVSLDDRIAAVEVKELPEETAWETPCWDDIG